MAKILVVDDEPHIVRLVEVNLERAGYEVVTASDGVEALEKVTSEKPDLVVLDILMPRMDGWGVMDALVANRLTRDVPFVVLSQLNTDVDIFRAWQKGCSVYLSKPFNPVELLEQIERVLKAIDTPGG